MNNEQRYKSVETKRFTLWGPAQIKCTYDILKVSKGNMNVFCALIYAACPVERHKQEIHITLDAIQIVFRLVPFNSHLHYISEVFIKYYR